jgi:hypothetical protein
MSHRIRIAMAVATLTAALTVVIAGSSAVAQTTQTANDPGVDYHRLDLHLRPTQFIEIPTANCTDDFGIGSGKCGGVSSSNPEFGSAFGLWWGQCTGQGHVGCPQGAIALTVQTGDNRIDGYILGRNKGEFYVTNAKVPAWHPIGDITSESAGRAGEKGGPLFIDVENVFGDAYNIDIRGYLLYKKLAQTFDISGYLDYAKKDDVLANHPFHAKLEVLDTPSSPKCSNPNFRGIGGCYGTFTADSDTPFVGSGGSAGIHWRQEDVTRVELVAPSGSRFGGQLDGSPDRFKVTYGAVPEWDVRTEITTGTFSGRTGEKGGPLRLTVRPCCAAPQGAKRPRAKIKDKDIDHRRGRARFKLRAKEGDGKVYLGCKLDGGPFKSCDLKKTYRHLDEGKHVFMVKAKDSTGQVSRKSAKSVFWI